MPANASRAAGLRRRRRWQNGRAVAPEPYLICPQSAAFCPFTSGEKAAITREVHGEGQVS